MVTREAVATERVKGRVIHVDLSGDSDRDFTVTIGPPPNLYFWKASGKPPHLGQLVSVEGEVVRREDVGNGEVKGTLTQVAASKWQVDPTTYVSRHVASSWTTLVRQVMRRPLYGYQVEGAAWVAARLASGKGAILGDEPGTGKTTQTVAVLGALQKWPVVVVCPSSLKHQWLREFQLAKHPPHAVVLSGKKGNLPRADVYIVNYDLLYAREAQLLRLNPHLYVFDEAQELRNPKAHGAHRAASATRLVRQRAKGALLLTGTPIENRAAELWRLLHLTEPMKWPRFKDYSERYCKPQRGKEIGRSIRTQAGRVERLNELHIELDKTMLRRLKSEVLKDLPPKSRRSLVVQLDADAMRAYRAAEKDVVQWFKRLGKHDRAERAAKALSLAKLTALRRIAARGKLRQAIPYYLERWFDTSTKSPLVVFSYHEDVLEGIRRAAEAMKLRVVGIVGGASSEQRQKAVDIFQAGRADIFLAPIRAAGVGLNLQRASDALFCERIWTPSGLIQAEDRVWRLGSTKPVTITYLDAAGTVDEHIARVVEGKQRLIRTVVDDDHEAAESLETAREVIEGLADSTR